MGDIRRKKKRFRKPKQPFDKDRIEEENNLIKKYGLKNKKEIWRAEAHISKIRKRAKILIQKSDEEKKKLFEKLNRIGFKVSEISDVLGMTKENWLDRRLQSFVFKKKLANNIRQARQLIIHKHVLVGGCVVNIPSFMITTDLENKVSLKDGRAIDKIKEKKNATEKVEEENGK